VYEKSLSKSVDVQAAIRSLAKGALGSASRDGLKLMELEFPPLVGGDESKSQFDDFDNIQELDRNKNWVIQFAPTIPSDLLGEANDRSKLWLIFPDLKECEIARIEWQGARYKESTYTTIEEATNFLGRSGGGGSKYDAPWGANLVGGLSKLLGGEKGDAGLLGDQSAVDSLTEIPSMNLFIQPGNGGPVEDWINCEKIYDSSPNTAQVVVNGALDKLRGGYYPAVFFPKLAASVDRYFKKFQSVLYLKPLTDKGAYGWLFRVYPEPWQVILQYANIDNKDSITVENIVILVSETRPDYNKAVAMLVAADAERDAKQNK